jgi:hypothetical protein
MRNEPVGRNRNEPVGINKVSGIDFVLKLFQSAPSQNREVVVRAQAGALTRVGARASDARY